MGNDSGGNYRVWLARHMALECIQVDGNGDLSPILCEDPEGIHRLYVVRHGADFLVYFRHDVPAALRRDLRQLTSETLFADHDRVQAIFRQHGQPSEEMPFQGKSYIQPDTPAFAVPPGITYFEDKDRCALLVDGAIASQCLSIRADTQAAEAYVETHPEHRQRGLGRIVVQAWTHRVLASGRVPFYSHKTTNIASQRLVESVGYTWYIDDTGYE
ncbi:MAG: GNAT family N-acetyltransferase [Anaerolineae bacterium]|nr:GNAT family N-acetyltransferase [Anaerolineae bacterium]